MPFSNYNAYKNIAGAATTVVKVGSGQLFCININTPATGVIQVYDNTAASGTLIATINSTTSVGPVSLFYDIKFNIGLTVVTQASQDITVSFA